MSLHILFPHLRGFRLHSSHREAKRLILTCERRRRTALCPVCGTAAHRIHSRYERTVWDLSVQNVQVILHLHVRKFYCDHPDCPRRIFTERLPQVTLPHGRFTFGLLPGRYRASSRPAQEGRGWRSTVFSAYILSLGSQESTRIQV